VAIHYERCNKMDEKKGYVYILFNKPNGTLYTGVTAMGRFIQ